MWYVLLVLYLYEDEDIAECEAAVELAVIKLLSTPKACQMGRSLLDGTKFVLDRSTWTLIQVKDR